MALASCWVAGTFSLLVASLLAWALISFDGASSFDLDEDGLQAQRVSGVYIYDHQPREHAFGRRLRRGKGKDWMLVLDESRLKGEQAGQVARRICLAAALVGGKCVSNSPSIAVVHATKKQLRSLLKVHGSSLSFVEADAPMQLIPELPSDGTLPKSANVHSRTSEVPDVHAYWGRDRIDAHYGYDNFYDVMRTGAGVDVYVLDSGIRTTHADFAGRAIPTLEVLGDGVVECNGTHGDKDCAQDFNGHGTHCAGTIGSAVHGVAIGVTLHAVKVLSHMQDGRTEGQWSWIIEALDWIKDHAKKPAVVSASLGGSDTSKAVRKAFESVVKSGVTVVVAAGNDNDNACKYEPARISELITVGATTWEDKRAKYSNYGSCLDMFAPGSDIISTGIRSDSDWSTLSGTSMAAPHVAGAAALLLQRNPKLTPKGVASTLKVEATRGVVADRKGSDNLFLYVGPEPCEYQAHKVTAVNEHGTGGKKLKRKNYDNDTEYLNACKKECNADSKCKGFVDDPTDKGGRQCKPKKRSSGYKKEGKIFHVKGVHCLPLRN